MGMFHSNNSNVNTSTQRISSFQVNQSSYGCPLKLIFGTAMVSLVLLDYQDFKAIAHTTTTTSGGGKGGGGKVTQSQTDYTYTVAVVCALGEGPLCGVGKVWTGSKTTSLSGVNMAFFSGKAAQAAWGYMLSKHPSHAITYSGTSYIAGNVNLGSSASLPNMNVEVYGLCQSKVPPNRVSATKTATASVTKTQQGTSPIYKGKFTKNVTVTDYYKNKGVTVSGKPKKVTTKITKNGTDATYKITAEYQGLNGDVPSTANITIKYLKSVDVEFEQPTRDKMQQFAYSKEIEISNFSSNRYVKEYVFNSRTGSGSWQTLNSRYYTITQSTDAHGNTISGVYTYTFNFDDRQDGYDRADPTYVRIYYTATYASVEYKPTDANPRDIIYTLLTSTVYGENFPEVLIDEESLASYSTYCKRNSILISPVYDQQTACSDIIDSLMECTNSAYVFSQGKVKIVPYWDGLTPVYAITDRNIIDQGNDTVTIERTSQADTYNIIPLEHTSRSNNYNSNVVYATDEGDIELHGVRQAGTYSHPEIMTPALAQAVAQIILQKQLYNRNTYKVRLGQEFILLEPMDACTIQSTLSNLGLSSVRVLEITENVDDFTLDITFEDNLSGVTTAPTYDTQETDSASPDTDADPGNINEPIIFEAPAPLVTSATGYEVWIYASGDNAFWGGANVWISNDGETYRQVGTIRQPARQGLTTTTLPVGDNPDTTNTLGIDLEYSLAEIAGGTQQDADDYVTLCWVAGEGNGEFISYQNATLTGTYTYDLSYLRRGVYGSTIMAHDTDAQFVRCDNAVPLKIPFNSNEVGNTYYIKFTSFNVFDAMEQDLSEVDVYSFTFHGYNKQTLMESGTSTINKDTATTITYRNRYATAPYPQVTITNSQSGDLLHVTNMTTTSFDAYFENDNAEILDTTRSINYLVYGST